MPRPHSRANSEIMSTAAAANYYQIRQQHYLKPLTKAPTLIRTYLLDPDWQPYLWSQQKSFTSIEMDAGKVPVKLVKVTRVLGRTGMNALFSLRASRWLHVTDDSAMLRVQRRCDAGACGVHGRYKPKHYSERQGTRYAPNHLERTSLEHKNVAEIPFNSQTRRHLMPAGIRTRSKKIEIA
jgi:hypothetical protein